MEFLTIPALVCRILQLIFAAVVLGVAVDFYHRLHHLKEEADYAKIHLDFDGLFPSFAYVAFTGAFGLLAALVGLVGAFVSAIPWIVLIVFDGLATIFFLAGGIRLAVYHSINKYCSSSNLCTEFKADEAFLWLGFLGSVAALVLVVLSRHRGGGGRSYA